MESQFVEYFVTNWPLPTLIIITIVGLVILAYRTGVLFTKMKVTNDKVNDLPCAENKKDIDNKVDSIFDEIYSIRLFLQSKYPKSDVSFIVKRSPYMLNKNGLLIYEKIQGELFLQKNKELLFEKLDSLSPKTALDVESKSLDVLVGLLENDIFVDIKNFVYLSPAFEFDVDGEMKKYNLTIADVCAVLSISLRDMYLEKHSDKFQIGTEK